MKQLVFLLLNLCLALPAYSDPQHEAIEKAGGALAKQVAARNTVKLRQLANPAELERFLQANGCSNYQYQAYHVDLNGQRHLYLVASHRNQLIAGKHFRAPLDGQRVKVGDAESSTTTCLNLGRSPADGALTIIHGQALPSEFHVMLSLLHDVRIDVSTTGGLYRITNGRIIPLGKNS